MKPAALLTALLAVGVAAVFFLSRGGERDEPDPSGEGAPLAPDATGASGPSAAQATAGSADAPEPALRAPARSTEPAPSSGAEREAVRTTPEPKPDWTSSRQFFHGYVHGPGGAIEGARVAVVDGARRELRAARSVEDGSFRVPLPGPVPEAWVQVRAPGYAPFENGPFLLRQDEKRLVGFARLQPASTVTGRVVADGEPVAGARVELLPGAVGRAQNRYRHEVQSDARGEFRIEDAPAGDARLEVTAAGYGKAWHAVAPVGTRTPAVVELERAPPLIVAVRGPERALAGARVRLIVAGRDGGTFTAETDGRGQARIDGLPTARWTGTVTAAGFHPADLRGFGTDGSPHTVALVPLACVRGRVDVAQGALPADTRVTALPVGPDGVPATRGERAEQAVGAEGLYELCGLAPGRWLVRASAPGFAPSDSAVFTVERDGSPGAVDLRLTVGGTLEVRAAGVDGALADAEVVLRGPSTQLDARTDPRGRARFERLAPGDYEVELAHPAHLTTRAGPFIVQAREAPTLAVVALDPGRSVFGTVHAPDGAPLSGASVTVQAVEPGGSLRVVDHRQSAADGSFRSAPLAPGVYRILARASRHSAPGVAEHIPEARSEVTLETGADLRVDLFLSE